MKVCLVAIAKDESAYLPEWIFHHLEMGFDKIKILLNGTTDHSQLVLERIKTHSSVSYEFIDDLLELKNSVYDFLIESSYLQRNPLQSRGYAKSFLDAKKEGFDYIFYLDIDEFLVSTDTIKIQELLKQNDFPSQLLVRYFNASGDKSNFQFYLNKIIIGVLGEKELRGFKFCLSTSNENFIFYNSHIALYLSGEFRDAWIGFEDKTINTLTHCKEDGNINGCFILHRRLRSEIEYLSLLARGDTFRNSEHGLKLNRNGWKKDGAHTLVFDKKYIKTMKNKYKQFILKNELADFLEVSKLLVINRALRTIRISKEIVVNYKQAKKILQGTSIQTYLDMV